MLQLGLVSDLFVFGLGPPTVAAACFVSTIKIANGKFTSVEPGIVVTQWFCLVK